MPNFVKMSGTGWAEAPASIPIWPMVMHFATHRYQPTWEAYRYSLVPFLLGIDDETGEETRSRYKFRMATTTSSTGATSRMPQPTSTT